MWFDTSRRLSCSTALTDGTCDGSSTVAGITSVKSPVGDEAIYVGESRPTRVMVTQHPAGYSLSSAYIGQIGDQFSWVDD